MSPEIQAYQSRCQVVAQQLRAFALLLFVTRLGTALILELPLGLGLDLEAIIILLLARDMRQGGPWSMRWILVLCLIELFNLVVLIGSGVAVRRWGLSSIGGMATDGAEFIVLMVLAVFFAGWAVLVGWRVVLLLREHPTAPPGRVFRAVLGLCVTAAVLFAPMRVALLRQVLFSQFRDDRSRVVEVDGQTVWERVVALGPREMPRLGMVMLIPVPDGTESAVDLRVPEALRIQKASEHGFVLAPEDSEATVHHDVDAGSALWWDPETNSLSVLNRKVTLSQVAQEDYLDRLLPDGPPSRLKPVAEPAPESDAAAPEE
ncbi:MAG: hypothetical protein PF961_23815 [Planctomycetota bacterium]|nr:hypothetical protein [Planctomycetota bacterium]